MNVRLTDKSRRKETATMTPRHKFVSLAALLTATALLGLWLAGCSGVFPSCPDPCPDYPDAADLCGSDIPTEGTTNLSDLVLEGDLTTGDDITVGDDLTVTDAATIGGTLTGSGSMVLSGNISAVAVAASGLMSANGGFASDINQFTIANTTGNTVIAGTVLVDADGDAVNLTVQEYTTPTNAALVVEDSAGTDVAAFSVAPVAAGSFDLLDLTDTTPILDGSDTVNGIDINLTGANHTGSGNTITGIDIDLTTADAQADEIAIELSDTDWDTGIKGAYGLEHIGLPTIASTAVATDTDGAIWTIGDGEIWYIHTLFCNVTTNFDCTGDDCTIEIGDGGDIDGLLDLDDAELQTTDTEGTGAGAGWQGFMSTDTVGAYVSNGVGYVYAPSGAAETIDIKIEDNSDQSDPTAGAATCYLVYTRLE
jgi:hypothetical protein